MWLEFLTCVSGFITAAATGVMVWAVWKAPQKALEVQWKLQLRNEERQRRMQVFRTLIATRGNVLHNYHVEALNVIDVEFSTSAETDVRNAWKAYLDHLNTRPPDEKAEPDDAKRKAHQDKHEEIRKDLLAELLQKMGSHLGYNFDFTYLKQRAYYPEGHGKVVDEESQIRKGWIEVLWNGRMLMMGARIITPPIDLSKSSSSDKLTS